MYVYRCIHMLGEPGAPPFGEVAPMLFMTREEKAANLSAFNREPDRGGHHYLTDRAAPLVYQCCT